MKIETGEILTGKVTGIAKFGAFVELQPGKTGLVYISEIANTFVKEVSEHLTLGQEVTVKVVSVDEQGRINLSIKQALPQEKREPARRPVYAPPQPVFQEAAETSGDVNFEDRLKKFMKDSESRQSDVKRQRDSRGGGGKRRR